jgi:replication factor C small subunit
MKELWVEKYRPKTLDGYVWIDSNQKKQVEAWIKDQSIPHLLLSGSPGIGKTTMAKMLISELGIEDYDVLEINASRTNSVDDVRETITNFVSMIPFGPFKVVLLDEADYLSHNAQGALRGVMEEYHQTARFILTCNKLHLIMDAIKSRCQHFHFKKIDPTEFTARVATILVDENIEFELDTLDSYVSLTYPDLRKCINTVQQNCRDGKLFKPSKDNEEDLDWKFEMIELFKSGKIRDARKLLCGKLLANEMEEIYTWLYNHVEIFGDQAKQDSALFIIKQSMVDHSIIIDPEINLSACLVKLARLNE